MDNLDDSENNAKISDSGYSNSCSNSQSRRSHSSKSTRSGSNSSGSSGYGGKPSTSGYGEPPEKRSKDKDAKKKKPLQTEITEKNETECKPEPLPFTKTTKEDIDTVAQLPTSSLMQVQKVPDSLEVVPMSDTSSGKDECDPAAVASLTYVTSNPISDQASDGFSCVISMQDGIVMYTTPSVTTLLGFSKDMWIGRSFIDFVHQRDRDTFASQITKGLAIPKNVEETQLKASVLGEEVSTMVCRIRRYKGLGTGFGIKDRIVTFMPFLLKFFFKNMNEEDGPVIYLVVQATPFISAFKSSKETLTNPIPFMMRHAPNGKLDYIDLESVPYLGYLPQDIMQTDALMLYHPNDLKYLRQVYETIVKEGNVERSKPYRMMAQNGDYLKLQTEWTSFINPWSRKLEFVIGKHFIVEGPENPDVFQTPENDKCYAVSIEEERQAQALRENMIRIMNEVLTKPAETAKQHMGKRCQDLASFMETLIDDTPKPIDEIRPGYQDASHSCYERDSVMLGGISPHRDYNYSSASTETPLSYKQINYNENLQRYFDCHEPYVFEDNYGIDPCKHSMNLHGPMVDCNKSDPLLNNLGEFDEWGSTSGSSAVAIPGTSRSGAGQVARLTESLLMKHNAEMEKKLVKMRRDARTSNKGDRERASNECRQKKMEHLARCNASYQPTSASLSKNDRNQHQGVKRSSKQTEDGNSHKHRCTSSTRMARRRYSQKSAQNQQWSSATNNVPSPWSTNPVNKMNGYMLGLGVQPPVTVVNPMTMPGMMPIYYVPTTSQQLPQRMEPNNTVPQSSTSQYYQQHQSAGIINQNSHYQPRTKDSNTMYHPDGFSSSGANRANQINDTSNTPYRSQHATHHLPSLNQAIYGSPFMYSRLVPQTSYGLQQTYKQEESFAIQPLGLSSRNYEEACKLTMPMKTDNSYYGSLRREKKAEFRGNKVGRGRGSNKSSVSAMNRSNDADEIFKRKSRLDASDGTNDKTDGESSYSSFYSSFFKTDSGSNEESDTKLSIKKENYTSYRNRVIGDTYTTSMPNTDYTTNFTPNQRVNNKSKVARRKMEPPWLEHVCVTSELIYKYQVMSKNVDEVLSNDKEKLKHLEQPSLVNEQLGQLYEDLQLEGVAARLSLEEGITSSSSSGDDTPPRSLKLRRRKRHYSRLVMIYEEDAPLPSPDECNSSSTS